MNTTSQALNQGWTTSAVRRTADPDRAWKSAQIRSRILLALMMMGFAAVVVRAFMLQLVNADQWQSRAEKRFERPREVPAARGRVLDRNGNVIATSVREELLGIAPSKFKADSKRIAALAEIIGRKPADVSQRIGSAKSFFWLAKGLNLEQVERIRALRFDGVVLEPDFRRYYPYGEAFAHVVGFTNSEEQGSEGLELKHDPDLRGKPGQVRVVVDRTDMAVSERLIADATPGRDLMLSLDAGIQTIVHTALRSAMSTHRAKAASAVVLDAQTGEVLALANEPSFDPNHRGRLLPDNVRNRAVTDAFEPGSTMKVFSIAAAIELGRVKPKTEVQTAPGKITIGDRTIGDSHPHGLLTVEEVLSKSSNVGTVKVSQRLQPWELHDFLAAAGFGRIPDVGLNGATGGRLRDPRKWVAIDQATISYGHGISVSLLQMARAYTIFARDGDIVPISFVPQEGPVHGVQVISPETARAVRRMLEMATGPEGTAPLAQVAGYRVAGKTGTAHKPERGGYAKNRYVASFVGFAPADRPRFIIAVMVDEPSAGQHFGGQVAAPVFSRIANDTLRRMQISPNPSLRVLPAVALIGEGSQ